jgi:hypothetical protein
MRLRHKALKTILSIVYIATTRLFDKREFCGGGQLSGRNLFTVVASWSTSTLKGRIPSEGRPPIADVLPMYPIEHEESAANRSAATGKRSRLCDKCENIDFESALRSAAQSRLKNEAVRILIANVGNRLRQSTIHNCDLCSRLAKNRIGDVCGDEDEIFGIDPHDLWEALGRKGGLSLINDPLYLFIKDVGEPKDVLIAANRGELGVKKELLICTLEANKQLNASLPRVLPSRFDAGHVLPWLQDCFNNHGNVCAKKVRHVSGLQLIDCHSMNITDAPVGATYTALSYVVRIIEP